MTQGIKSCQRGSKRLIEEIARLWLRVQGEQAVAKFQHGVVNWQSEEDKQTVALMKQEFYVIAQLMGWISGDKASQEVMGNKGAVGEPNENIRISFNNVKSKTINEKENTETT